MAAKVNQSDFNSNLPREVNEMKKGNLVKDYNAGLSNAELAVKYNLSASTIQKKLAEMRVAGLIRYRRDLMPRSPVLTSPERKEVYNEAVTTIEGIKKELRKATSYSKKSIPLVKHTGDTLVIHITDWHVGRTVKDELGNIIYDHNVFETRVDRLLKQILSLLDNNIRKGVPIKEVVIVSTGDILDGQGIFATQETLQELSPPFQVMKAAQAIQKLIMSLLERKLKVYFYGVKGNHGEIRVGGKSHDPNANWDLMLYLILELWIRTVLKSENVNIGYSELDYLNFEIQGWRYHIRHIAPKQSETGAGKGKILGWAKQHRFDVLVYGHYHSWGVWNRSDITIFRGGSIPGGDEYAETLAEESSPTQLVWGCNTKRPLTFFYPVDLGRKGLK